MSSRGAQRPGICRYVYCGSLALLGTTTVIACASGSSGGAGGGRGAYTLPGVYPPRDLTSARPQTRAERSGFTETSSHADVIAFLDSMRVGQRIHVGSIGRSSQGRDVRLVI